MVKYNIVKAKIFLHSEKISVIISEQNKLFKKVLTKTDSHDIVVRLGNRSFFYALF